MMSPKAFATLEHLVELRRQRAAVLLGGIRRGLEDVAQQSQDARTVAGPPPPAIGAVDPAHFQILSDLQIWEAARQNRLTTEREALEQALPAALARLQRARATVQAMELLGKRVEKAEQIRKSRKEELAAAAEAANRPK